MRIQVMLMALATALAGCGSVTPTAPSSYQLVTEHGRPSPAEHSAAPGSSFMPGSAILSVYGTVEEFCGSIGGCAYYVDVVSPGGSRHTAQFEYRAAEHLVIVPSALPGLAPGSHTLTARTVMCSDAISNGVRECSPTDVTCDRTFDVLPGQEAIALHVTFRMESCTIKYVDAFAG
jgi:hypothetical protein